VAQHRHSTCNWIEERGNGGDLLLRDNPVKTPAIILIVVGIVIVVWGAFGFKTRDKVLDIGPIHATKETEHNVPYGPLAGALLAVGGVALLVKSKS
jgi:drug/metabolite transporter (DMT)-like permease